MFAFICLTKSFDKSFIIKELSFSIYSIFLPSPNKIFSNSITKSLFLDIYLVRVRRLILLLSILISSLTE